MFYLFEIYCQLFVIFGIRGLIFSNNGRSKFEKNCMEKRTSCVNEREEGNVKNEDSELATMYNTRVPISVQSPFPR